MLNFVSHTGVEGCSMAGKKNVKVVNEGLLKDEIVSEHLTRYCKMLRIDLKFSLQKLFLNARVLYC